MKPITKLTFALATLVLGLAIKTTQVQAQDNSNCVINYGGQVCGASTPPIAGTAGETDVLYTLSGILYTTGLTSFVIAKKADKIIPFLD